MQNYKATKKLYYTIFKNKKMNGSTYFTNFQTSTEVKNIKLLRLIFQSIRIGL